MEILTFAETVGMKRFQASISMMHPSWLLGLLMCVWGACARASGVVRVSVDDLQGDGTAVYLRLKQIHEGACALGFDTHVVYPRGICIAVTIPAGATPIPLTRHTDFDGCTFQVENTSVDKLFLFSLDRRADLQDDETVYFDKFAGAARRVNVSGEMIDGGDFSSIPALAKGHRLLYVYDPKVWSIGGVSGTLEVYRRDIIYIVNGRAQNMPIRPYSESKGLVCLYDDVEQGRNPSFEHLFFSRTATSSKRTFLLKACGQVGLQVRDVCINTPEEDTALSIRPEYEGDQCLYIRHSVNTLLEDVRVNGTYSAEHRYGYGMRFINMANTSLRNVQGDGAWGVQCGFYLNTVTLDGCTLNRFDCHCYCADFTYRHCVFQTDTARYSSENCSCQVSCASGYMQFAHCRFVKARPMIVNPMYSGGFSGFELSYLDCAFDVLPRYNYLVEGLRFDDTEASRSLPNLYMRDCVINAPDGTEAGRYYLYHFNNQGNEDLYHNTVEYLDIVSLDNVQVVANGQNVPMWLCNKKLNYRKDMLRRVVSSSCDSIAYPLGL